MILYGTKLYLSQAEVTTKPPSSFTPFSVALGNRIVVLYSTLTQALAGESSLPVLTQILKCLAVLVQSTSFQKLQNAPGLIKGFVVYIRRLVHHKGKRRNEHVFAFLVQFDLNFICCRPYSKSGCFNCNGISIVWK